MGLWKRIKENRSEKKSREERTSTIRPKSVLVWIDAACNDLPARVVRGLAIAEAFRIEGIDAVSLACLQNRNLPEEANRRNIQWIDSRPDGNPITFTEIVKTSNADFIVADSCAAPRLQNDLRVPLLALLSDSFSPPLLEGESIHAAVLPGLISPPDFEHTRILPSRIGNCLHGAQYVPIPACYRSDDTLALQENHVLLTLAGNVEPESYASVIQAVQRYWSGEIIVLADIPAGHVQKLQEIETSGENVKWVIDPPLTERIEAIRNAVFALAFPSLNVYELWACQKPVVLLPRNDGEKRIGQMAIEQNIARMVPLSETPESLDRCIDELVNEKEAGRILGESARTWMPEHGARNIVNALLARFERIAG